MSRTTRRIASIFAVVLLLLAALACVPPPSAQAATLPQPSLQLLSSNCTLATHYSNPNRPQYLTPTAPIQPTGSTITVSEGSSVSQKWWLYQYGSHYALRTPANLNFITSEPGGKPVLRPWGTSRSLDNQLWNIVPSASASAAFGYPYAIRNVATGLYLGSGNSGMPIPHIAVAWGYKFGIFAGATPCGSFSSN